MRSTRKTNYEKEIRILILEDLSTDVDLAKRELEKAGINFVYTVVETEKDFRRELTGFHPDIIISDYSMPTFDGMSALQIVREGSEYYPFIILTGSMNEETAVSCMKAEIGRASCRERV
jgi:CheY-like chemotaxis protein